MYVAWSTEYISSFFFFLVAPHSPSPPHPLHPLLFVNKFMPSFPFFPSPPSLFLRLYVNYIRNYIHTFSSHTYIHTSHILTYFGYISYLLLYAICMSHHTFFSCPLIVFFAFPPTYIHTYTHLTFSSHTYIHLTFSHTSHILTYFNI